MPLRLMLEVYDTSEGIVFKGGCGIKVFKDKGGDRKQRQDQLKIEKLSFSEQVGMATAIELTFSFL